METGISALAQIDISGTVAGFQRNILARTANLDVNIAGYAIFGIAECAFIFIGTHFAQSSCLRHPAAAIGTSGP